MSKHMSFSFQGREAAPPASAGVGVGGPALGYTQRRCGAVKVESEADLDGPQNPPDPAPRDHGSRGEPPKAGGEAPLIKVRSWR
jgi:hypothetical protein